MKKRILISTYSAAALIAFAFLVGGCGATKPQDKTGAAAAEATTGTDEFGTFTCSESQRANARSILASVTTGQGGLEPLVSSALRGGDGLTFTFSRSGWGVIETRLREVVEAIANSDACIAGRARRLNFNSPSGALVAYADPVLGIRLQ